ncbi:MAG: hypothetical protein IJY83_04480 [Oscillospiraceae bacterium]|nr:hypothetical protein [Oscillospiraceae bacterium]
MKMKNRLYAIAGLIFSVIMAFSGCDSDFFPLEENPYKQTETTVSVSETAPTYYTEPFIPIETTEEPVSETTETTTTFEETTTPETTTTTVETTTEVTTTTTVATTTPAVTETAPQTTKTTTAISLSVPSAPRKEIYRSYAYNTLTEKEKKAYDIFEGAAVSLSNKADFEGLSLTKEELEKVVYAFDLYEPLYSYVSLENCMVRGRNGIVKDVDMAYYYDKSTHSKMTSAAVSEADKIIAKVTPKMSDYEVLKLFHDEIIKRCVYDKTAQNRNFMYGVLVEGRATCTGYAKTFQYLCNRVGIENTCVFGNAGGEGHMWNMVKLDGEWYEVDTTWDDTTLDDFDNEIFYEFFLVDTAKMSDRQLFDYNYNKPVAYGKKYYYYNVTGTYAQSIGELKTVIKNSLKNAIKENKTCAQAMCSDRAIADAVADLANSGELFYLVTEVEKETGYTFNKAEMKYYTLENANMILITF